ncbi:MAG: class I SAM-dependent methyltransferase [Desulfobulbaceae bacterium]|nr:class I SAM-dependent methyltransferase [Desulfobulbaceae bacterium]
MIKNNKPELTKQYVIDKWSGQYGMNNLYNSSLAEAEPHIGAIVLKYATGIICEVGCGNGRVANLFPHNRYIGIDISKKAITAAKERLPGYQFEKIKYDADYPEAQTFLFYTVLVHVPDESIESVFTRVKKAGAKRIIIYEAMTRWFRQYSRHQNFHRDVCDYRGLAKQFGYNESHFYVVKSKSFPWFGNVLILDLIEKD